ncbi:MAG: arylsulfatase [Planctomycetota bacterium]
MYKFSIQLVILVFAILATSRLAGQEPNPNIVVILADDLGYGDIRPNNPESAIPTPAFDRLANEGVNFLDAHSGSSVCTPTRYGLLCGKYCWRTRLKRGVLGGYSEPLIDKNQPTIASILKSVGYRTACIGKWHLGLGWQWKQGKPDYLQKRGFAGKANDIDYSKPVTDGPLQHGFDECFIIPASLDMSPYVYVKNENVSQIPQREIAGSKFPVFFRKGEISTDFTHIQCLSHLKDQANAFIEKESKTDNPFFLYFPMPAPHKPVVPMDRFRGKTPMGSYGDFVAQVDWTVGEVLKTIDQCGIADETLVIVTSDNGSFMKRLTPDAKDHIDDDSIQGYRGSNHQANGTLRGTKADIWEAGHRVPFLVRWPSQDRVGQNCSATICLTDILATVADAARISFESKASPDSFSFLADAFQNRERNYQKRPPVIHHSSGGMFAIRDGKWKLVLGNGSGGREAPKGKPFQKPFHLSNLESDLGESINFADQYHDVAVQMTAEFFNISKGDHETYNTKIRPKQNQ